MAEDKKETKKPEKKVEEKASRSAESRDYVIPLREKCLVVPRYKKTPKAIKTIKEFIARHMKVVDRDLNKVKLDNYLNEFLWARGIKRPPHKVKVKATREGENVRVELVEYPTKLKFKKVREDKFTKASEEVAGKKKSEKKAVEKKAEAEKKKAESEEDKKEESEKKASVEEEGKALEKAAAKTAKHQTQTKSKEPKRQQRKALEK